MGEQWHSTVGVAEERSTGMMWDCVFVCQLQIPGRVRHLSFGLPMLPGGHEVG